MNYTRNKVFTYIYVSDLNLLHFVLYINFLYIQHMYKEDMY